MHTARAHTHTHTTIGTNSCFFLWKLGRRLTILLLFFGSFLFFQIFLLFLSFFRSSYLLFPPIETEPILFPSEGSKNSSRWAPMSSSSHKTPASSSNKGNLSLTCYPDTLFNTGNIFSINAGKEESLCRQGESSPATQPATFAVPINPNANAWVMEKNAIANAYENSLPHILPGSDELHPEIACKPP